MTLRARSAFFCIAALLAAPPAFGGAAPAPQFGSLSRDQVYLREGPSYQHRVLWIYHRRDWPVLVLGTYDIWKRVRDADGTTGWIYGTMVSDRRSIVVTAKRPAAIRQSADPASHPIAYAQHGVVARLEACEALACKISADGTEGWIKKTDIWGVGVGEVFK